MKMTLFTADCRERPANCFYPHKTEISTAEELAAAVRHDHVCARYKKNYRSNENFLESDVIVLDCDNDHSEDPEKWLTAEKLEDVLADVDFAVVPSRHYMLPKGILSARPRFHVFAPIHECRDAECYGNVKRAVQKMYPFFDDNAVDAARFLFGSDAGPEEIVWHEGWMLIDDGLEIRDVRADEGTSGGAILQGSRNNTLSRFAGRIIKRFGEGEKAHQVFLKEAEKCDPPLEDEELANIWNSALKFFRKKISGKEGYVPPDEYNDDFGTESLRPGDYSDIGQAKALVKEYGNELRYSEATDYLRYDGRAWIEERQLAVGAAEEFLDLQLQEAADELEAAKKVLLDAGIDAKNIKAGGKQLEKNVGSEQLKEYFSFLEAKAYYSFVMKHRDWKYIVSALNAAKPMIAVKVGELDRDEDLLNTPDGTYDMKKGMDGRKSHEPQDLITKMTACSPGNAGMELWEDSVRLFFGGDRELSEYVQMVVGMAAVGKVYQEHLIIAYGDGANGKSTFWNTISRVMGTYSGRLSADALTMNCRRNVKPEMAELKGKRLIIASEMQEGMRLNTSVVKQLCSTDEVFAEKKYKAPFSFTPSHTLVLYTNHLPRVGANDEGIWRRLIVIPFNAKIIGDSDIKNYADYLFDKAGPYILKWIIEGAQKVIEKNFRTELPKCVKDAVEAYREENDWLGHFINEMCDVDISYMEKSGELYQKYREYSMQNGEYVRGNADFYSAIENAGYWKHKSKKGAFIHGLKLKDGTDFL